MTSAKIAEQAPGHVQRLSPYVPGKPIDELAREYGLAEAGIVKLASNENPRGPSAQRAKQAIVDAACGRDALSGWQRLCAESRRWRRGSA